MRQPQSEYRSAGVPPALDAPAENTHSGWRSRGYIPHFDAPHLTQRIVFRLSDSLPTQVQEEIDKVKRHRVAAIDAALDAGHGRRDLANPAVAQLVQTALLAFDAERYPLLAWCIMPNHVHVLAETEPGHRVDRIVHGWKSYTAKQANLLLGRRGSFWAPEYFDRFMRNDEHLAKTAAYIEGNPVKAGLCEDVRDWPFSSAWHGYGGRDARAPIAPDRSGGRDARAPGAPARAC